MNMEIMLITAEKITRIMEVKSTKIIMMKTNPKMNMANDLQTKIWLLLLLFKIKRRKPKKKKGLKAFIRFQVIKFPLKIK